MFALCVEASKTAGYGHFFRSLLIAKELVASGEKVLFFMNKEERLYSKLKESGIDYLAVDSLEAVDWRKEMTIKFGIRIWIEDRLRFSGNNVRELKEAGVLVVGLDLVPEGDEFPDLVFSIMPCFYGKCKASRQVLEGPAYFVLDPLLKKYRRQREQLNKLLVMFGGTDTHALTGEVVSRLRRSFTLKVILGAGVDVQEDWGDIQVVHAPTILYSEFHDCDLAVCAGGISPFEMISTGLPVCMIATEPHERRNAKFIEDHGMGVLSGDRSAYQLVPDYLNSMDWRGMSKRGLSFFSHSGAGNLINKIKEYT